MKNNRNSTIGLIIIFGLFVIFFSQKYISNEIEQYKLYNDFTRGSQVMAMAYNKNFDIQYPLIRSIQASNISEKETKGSLIYDFANHDIIPILNYLNSESVNENLIDSFSDITNFFANYNVVMMPIRENVLVHLDGNNYYTYENGVYTYKIKKKVIKKEFFQKTYNQYLKSINENNLQENFIDNLYKSSDIKNSYTYDTLVSNVKNNYEQFYKRNEDIIVDIIASDLKNFNNYINEKVIYIPEDSFPSLRIDEKDIETEEIEIYYKFTELDRIYSPVSKYYTHSFQLDIDDVWKQIDDLGYPKLYN